MPILIKDYEWDQNDLSLSLKFSLHNNSKNVDVLMTSSYIKVNFLPYIFEAFLYHTICPKKSTYKISDGFIAFHLVKQSDSEHWDKFSLQLCKEVANDARNMALNEHEENVKKDHTRKNEERILNHRLTVEKQIVIDEAKRQNQKKKLQEEKEKFFKSADNGRTIRVRSSSSCSDEGLSCVLSEGDYDADIEENIYGSPSNSLSSDNDCFMSPARRMKKKELKRAELPPVRQSRIVTIQMTPRRFPTPSRESTADEEEKILQQNKAHEAQLDSTDIINFLSSKAMNLFERGDHVGCVNALTEAITLSPCRPSLYSNRAAGHLALEAYHSALEDCTKALELLTPLSKENRKSRLLCHSRRGYALLYLHKYAEGLEDYYTALVLDPNNESLIHDIEAIESLLTSSESSDSESQSDESADSDVKVCSSSGSTEESGSPSR